VELAGTRMLATPDSLRSSAKGVALAL